MGFIDVTLGGKEAPAPPPPPPAAPVTREQQLTPYEELSWLAAHADDPEAGCEVVEPAGMRTWTYLPENGVRGGFDPLSRPDVSFAVADALRVGGYRGLQPALAALEGDTVYVKVVSGKAAIIPEGMSVPDSMVAVVDRSNRVLGRIDWSDFLLSGQPYNDFVPCAVARQPWSELVVLYILLNEKGKRKMAKKMEKLQRKLGKRRGRA